MERNEIVKFFLNNKYQLSLEALEFFSKNTDKISFFLNLLKQEKEQPTIITNNIIEKFLKGVPSEIKILKNFEITSKPQSIEHLTKFFNKRYEDIKKILSRRIELVNLISINKISEKTKKFSLITLLKEKYNDGSLIIEDPTGTTTVYYKNKDKMDFDFLVNDEVVGLVCERKNNDILINRVIWPNTPLKKEVAMTSTEINCLFISDLHMNSPEFNRKSYEKFINWFKGLDYENLITIVLGDVSNNIEDIKNFFHDIQKKSTVVFIKGEIDPQNGLGISPLNDPCIIKIENVSIFISYGKIFSKYYNFFKTSPERVLVNLIKKRHLNPIFDIAKIYGEDIYFLDFVPDIFAIGHFHEPATINYKGITIISNGSFVTKPIFWLINLKTRENIKIDFT